MSPRHLLRTALAAGLLLAPLALVAPAPTSASAAPARSGTAALDRPRGDWSVAVVGTGRFQVTWTSPTALPVGSDRPLVVAVGDPAPSVGPTVVGARGRTVSAVVTAATAPDAAGLDVVLSGDRLDVAGDDVARSARAAAGRSTYHPTRDPRVLTDDPGEPGDLETTTWGYRLRPLPVAGMPKPIEMVGHVVEPFPGQLDAAAPLVLLLHGRHSYCYVPGTQRLTGGWPCAGRSEEIPSHLGYDYIQQLLASQGFVTVSVRVNGINAQDSRLLDGGAGARSTVVQAHLDHWVDLAREHRVDLDEVVLVGHSRGGEGVDRASIEIPLDAPYRIAGQVLIAPTDFGSQTAPYVPTVTLLPYCDGDVSDLQGQRFTDVSRGLVTGDTSMKSSVMVLGANHNFFNTEWTPGVAVAPANDDWSGADGPCGQEDPERLTAAEQRSVGATYVAGAARLFTGDEEFLPLFDGSDVTVPSIGDATVLSHALGGGRDTRAPGLDGQAVASGGGEASLCRGRAGGRGACVHRWRGVAPHWLQYGYGPAIRDFVRVRWSAPGRGGGLSLDDPLDLTGRRLELRVITRPQAGDLPVTVRLSDAEGGTADLTPTSGPVAALPVVERSATKLWAQTVLVDPADAAGVDLAAVTTVELLPDTEAGDLWLADLSAAADALAPVPMRRGPVIDVGRVSVAEGDERGTQTFRVPLTRRGGLQRAVTVRVDPGLAGSGVLRRVSFAAGQREATVAVPYSSDRRDGVRRFARTISAWPADGGTTGTWTATSFVLDDDPTPEVTLEPGRSTVAEGGVVRWRLVLARPVDYSVSAILRLRDAPGPDLRQTDVPRSFLRELRVDPGRRKLHLLRQLRRVGSILPGEVTSLPFVVPIRRDGAREPTERLRLRAVLSRWSGPLSGRRANSTVDVVDR